MTPSALNMCRARAWKTVGCMGPHVTAARWWPRLPAKCATTTSTVHWSCQCLVSPTRHFFRLFDERRPARPSVTSPRQATALASGVLGDPPSAASLKSVMGRNDDADGIAAALVELGKLGVKGPAAAAWLRDMARVAARTSKPALVWSGPEVPGGYARDTRRVYEDGLDLLPKSGCA